MDRSPAALPEFPSGLVAVLATVAPDGPSAIPVSAVHRAGDREVLFALAHHRGSLGRLRADPRAALTLVGTGFAVVARGEAAVVADPLPGAEFVTGLRFTATDIGDAIGLSTVVHGGIRWGWRDAASARRHRQVLAALRALAG
ncbi:MAG: pyridoxamine 5'-phosphate oxidase family protein [Thermoleophilia bacterium]